MATDADNNDYSGHDDRRHEGDRRQELRREEDVILAQVLEARLKVVEDQIRTFAPTATQVAVHTTRIEDTDRRMLALESSLAAVDGTLDVMNSRLTQTGDIFNERINAILIRMEGMATKLALVIGIASLAGGGLVTLLVTLLTRS